MRRMNARIVASEKCWNRGDYAGDLKISELDVLVENWTCLNAPRGDTLEN